MIDVFVFVLIALFMILISIVVVICMVFFDSIMTFVIELICELVRFDEIIYYIRNDLFK